MQRFHLPLICALAFGLLCGWLPSASAMGDDGTPPPGQATLEVTVAGWRTQMAANFCAWLIPQQDPPGYRWSMDRVDALPITLDASTGVFTAPVALVGPCTLVVGVFTTRTSWGFGGLSWLVEQPVLVTAGSTVRVTVALDQLPVIVFSGAVWPPDAEMQLRETWHPRILPMGGPPRWIEFAPAGGLATLEHDTDTGEFTIHFPLTPSSRLEGVRVEAWADGHETEGVNVGSASASNLRLWLAPAWLVNALGWLLALSGSITAVLIPMLPGSRGMQRGVLVTLAITVAMVMSLNLLTTVAPLMWVMLGVLGVAMLGLGVAARVIAFVYVAVQKAAREKPQPFAHAVTAGEGAGPTN